MAEQEQELPSEEVQRITDAPPPYRNCTECGLWLNEDEVHSHEKNTG